MRKTIGAIAGSIRNGGGHDISDRLAKAGARANAWVYRFGLIFLAFALVYPVYFYATEIADGGHSWKTADWLINNEGGAVRRGLMGSLILHLGSILQSPLWLAFALQSLFFAIAAASALVLYFSGSRGSAWLVVLLSPVFLTFAFHDLSGGFRKELIGFSAFGLLAASYVRRWAAIPMTIAAALIFTLAVFSHEANALALPFFLFVLWRGAETGLITRRAMGLAGAAFTVIAASSVLFAIAFRGDAATAAAICEAIVSNGLRRDLFCEAGALLHLANSPSEDFKYVSDLGAYVRTYAVALVLGLGPLALIRGWSPAALAALALGAAAIAPLFLVAIDWGRWIYIYAFYAFCLAFAESIWRPMTIIPLPWPFALFSIAGWSIAHCCTVTIGTGLWGWCWSWVAPKVAALFALVT